MKKQYDESWFRTNGIRYLPEEEYRKLVGQYRLQLNGLFEGFCAKNTGTFTTAIVGMEYAPFLDEVVRLTEDYGLRIRGVDKPISLEMLRKKQRGA